MEVIPASFKAPLAFSGILHVCGGDPVPSTTRVYMTLVFSTYVEVIPFIHLPIKNGIGILHVCGGDPSLGTIF